MISTNMIKMLIFQNLQFKKIHKNGHICTKMLNNDTKILISRQ